MECSCVLCDQRHINTCMFVKANLLNKETLGLLFTGSLVLEKHLPVTCGKSMAGLPADKTLWDRHNEEFKCLAQKHNIMTKSSKPDRSIPGPEYLPLLGHAPNNRIKSCFSFDRNVDPKCFL